MALNFNVSPYFDDFDPNKNFHRILFKPGFAVQARELTQSQTILQDQISKFADHVFQKNTPISGAKLTYNTNCSYIKLLPTINNATIDVSLFDGALIQNTNGDVIARVLATAAPSGGDPDTLVVSYISGLQFQDNDVIYNVDDFNITAQAIALNATGNSSVASVSEGIFYVVNGFSLSQTTGTKYTIGHFVNVLPQTTILSKYDSNPNVRVGLNITETIYDYVNDTSLLDPADGSPNYQGPGADRYVIKLELETRPLRLGDDQSFIELMRIEGGLVKKQVDNTVYATIDDYFAKRTFDTNGDYIVNDFKLTPSANTSNNALYDLKIGKGTAYVRGYRLENQSDFVITTERARTTDSINNNSTFIEYGNYLYIDNANGVFDVTTMPAVDLHIVDKSEIVTTNTTTYNSTVAATAFIRGLEFEYYTSIGTPTSYVYKAYLADIQNKTLTANATAGATNTITFPATAQFTLSANAYYGATISIDAGASAGDVRRIVSYTGGSSRVATVDAPWTTTPGSSSVFTIRFDIKDVESVIRTSSGTTIAAWASINESTGKDSGSSIGNTLLQSKVPSELIYNLGYPYVASIADATYQTTQVFRGISFNGSTPTTTPSITYSAGQKLQFLGTSHENYIVINQTTGEYVSFANTSTRHITLSNGNKTLVLSADDLPAFTATVICQVAVTDATDLNNVLKIKNLVTANTTAVNITGTTVATYSKVDTTNGQTYIQAAGLVTPGSAQLLYVSDVKRIVKIIDTKASGTAATNAMLTDSSYDVTNNFVLDNGQRDGYYGHASIKLLAGRPKPKGNLLVLFDYYAHGGGDGYFSVESYIAPNSSSPENYGEIGSYTAKSGLTYNLRDSLDFRPTVKNAQASFVFDYTTSPSSTNAGVYIPTDNSVFFEDYSYYLGRKDRLVLSKDKNFEIIEGTPSINPLLPIAPDGSLVISNLKHDPYTNYVPGETPSNKLPNLSIEKVQHKRWTMQDISDLQSRVNNIEYYTALNLLEKNAQGLQISDANGLNRFKNGILVDDFSSFATADTINADFNASINRREKVLTASQIVDNFPLQSSYMLDSINKLDSIVATSLGFTVNTVGKTNIFTLPYTSANLASQTLASNTVNINQFATPLYEGVMSLSPPMDNWVDNTKQPDLLIIDPDLQIYQAGNTLNTLSVGDWKTIPGTSTTTSSETRNKGTATVTTQTYAATQQNNVLGYYDKLGASYASTNGFLTDISILPYIRPQQLLFKSKGLKINTPISTWFDGVSVDNYITTPDIIELKDVTGEFKEDDIIGYTRTSVFYPIATVVSVYKYPGTTNVRLGIVGNLHTSYTVTDGDGYIRNATYNSTGSYVGSTAVGTPLNSSIISIHKSGFLSAVGGSFTDSPSSATSVQYFKVDYGRYGAFASKYGVWGNSNGRGVLPTGTFDITPTVTGTHYVRVSGEFNEDTYVVKANGVNITLTGTGNYHRNGTITLTAGQKANVTFGSTNSHPDRDGHFAMAISTQAWSSDVKSTQTPGSVIFSTIDLHKYSTVPTNSGTLTNMEGGGAYYVGATQLSLSGLASNTSNYYVGSKIKINSTYVSVDAYTGKSKSLTSVHTANVTAYYTANTTVVLDSPVNVSIGFNTKVNADITSTYTLDGTYKNQILGLVAGKPANLSTDESGSFVGVFNIPAERFKTGERVFRIDNRTTPMDPSSASTIAEATFTASGLATKSQALEFSPSVDSASKSFTQTNYQSSHLISSTVSTYRYPYDPVAQTFIVQQDNYPNGVFLKSIKVFFQRKPTSENTPVTLSIVGTQNGYPNGETLAHSTVTKYPNEINISSAPHYLDPSSYTEFVFEVPVYIQSGQLYAFLVKSQSTDYNIWIAAQNAQAVASTTKNLPTDPTPATTTKIGVAPYVGSLFESQNAMTWTAEQGKSIMFVIENCVFDTTKSGLKIPFVIPQNLPTRKLTAQDIRTFYDANSVSNMYGVSSSENILSDAYNITTTDFVPTSTTINYSYKSTLNSNKNYTSEYDIRPGKFGCPTSDDIYLNDGLGERVLIANSNTSFMAYVSLSSTSNTVSPIISDDALSLYNVRWNINNMELSNTTVTVSDGGTGYNVATTTVTVSAPDDNNGTQAYATANISGGVIQSVDFITAGSGYFKTPTITVLDNATRSGNSNTSIVVHGETSSSGGNGLAKYFTKRVVLTPGNESGDLRVFYTAYRPLGTNINVYYKILNNNDNQEFDAGDWQLMTNISNTNTYSQSRNDLYEFEAAPGTGNIADNAISYTNTSGTTYTSFNQFAIKIVMSTNDNTNVPFLTDIRAIALPPGTGF
jgi:hypothetical protein